jgi:tetratricopeptide (TPR) repeat protein
LATGLDAQQKIFAGNPGDRLAFEALEEHFFLDGDWDALVEVYRARLEAPEIVDDEAQQAPLLFRLGQILEERILDSEAASEIYWTLARLDPTNRPALRQLRGIHEREEKWDLVLQIAELESATSMPPYDRASFETDLGNVWRRHLDDNDEARKSFERALEADPEFPPALEGLAELHQAAGDFERAAAVLTQLTERLRGPERAPIWIALGRLCVTQLDDPARAKVCFGQALEDDSFQPPAVEWLLLLATMEEDWPAVSELLERRFDLASGARHRAAIAVEASQIQLGHLHSSAAARAWTERALELAGEETSVLLARAEVERADGDRAALLEVLDKLITLSGDRTPRASLIEAAELHAEFGNSQAALDAIGQASKKPGQDDGRVLTLQASLLRESGSKSELAEVLETLTALDGGLEDSLRAKHLAELAHLQEDDLADPESAQASWQRTFDLDPCHGEAVAALERIHRKSDDWDALKSLFETALIAANEADEVETATISASLGMLLLEHFEDPAGARTRFESALASVPHCRPAELGLRRVAEETGDAELLLEVCEKEAEGCGDSGQMTELARTAIPILQGSERIEDALVWAMRWSQAVPDSREAFSQRADFQRQLRQVEAEIETRQKLAKLLEGRECVDSLQRQAELHLEQSDAEAAGLALELALKEEPAETQTLRMLCSVYRGLDRAQDLVRILRLLLDLIPNAERAEPLEELATNLQDPIGDLDGAVVIRWQLADLESAPDDASEKLEALLEMSGRYAELAQLLDVRRQQLGDESDLAFSLDIRRGNIFLDSLGQSERAIEIFSALHERHPQNEEILDQLERAFRVGDDAAGLCELIGRRADWETDESRRSAMFLERASILEEVLGEPLRAADLYEEIIRDHRDNEGAETASARLEILLESNGLWERLRDRLINRVDDLCEEEEATLRERIASICLDRLHDIAGCASQLEAIAAIVSDRVHVWQKLAELYADELDRPADWLRVTEAELETNPANDRELTLRVAAARLLLDDDRRPTERDSGEAYPHYERVLALHPTHPEAAEVLALHFSSAGRHEDTVRILEARLDGLDGSGGFEANDLRLRLASILSTALEDDERARHHLEAARADLGASADVATPLAELFERADAYEALRDLARESIEANVNEPENLVWRIRLGASERRCGNLEAAAAAYRAALLESPDDREIETVLMDLYEELDEIDPLTELLEKQLDYAPEEEAIDLRLRLARLNSERRNRPGEALDHLECILRSHPQHRDAFDQALQIADQIGEPQRVLALLDGALAIPLPSIERSVLLERRGRLLADSLDQPEQAVASLREALSLDRRNHTARRTLRQELEKLNRWPAVLDCLFVEAAESNEEERIELFEEAAEIAWSRVNPDASLPWLARLRDLRPEDPELLARLAEVHRRAGRFEAALRAYDEELELRSDDSQEYELHLQRARLLERELHAPGRAIFAYLHAAELAQDDSETLVELDRLYDTMGRPFERASVLELRVARLAESEGIELRQTLATLYCTDLAKPDLALPHLEANVAATRGNLREELHHLGALDAALRASSRHDAWARVAARELELIDSDEEIRESTPIEYRSFLREELARTYDSHLGAPDLAIEELHKLVAESEESNPRVLADLRSLYRRTGRFAELAENLSNDLESNSGTATDWLELARIREEKLTDLSGALDAYRSAEANGADTDEKLQAIRGQRRCSERLRDWSGLAEALESEYGLESALDRRQRVAIARQLGDLCWRRLGSGARASDGYRLALDLDPDDLETIRALTVVTEASMGPADAIPLYRRELDLLGDESAERQRRVEIWLKLATLYSDVSESPRESIDAILEAAKIERLAAPDELRLARLYEDVGEGEDFCETFGRWCDREDSAAEVSDHLELARHNQTRDDLEAAVLRAERATAIAPENSGAWSLLGELYRAEDQPTKAADAFQRAADHAPTNDAARFLVESAECIRDLELSRAHSMLNQAIELDPGAIEPHLALARVASELGEREETQRAAETAFEFAHAEPLTTEIQLEISVLGGRAARELGARDASRRLFEIALEVDADHIESLEGIAEAHFEDGDFRSARPLLEHRLELGGENPLRGRHLSMIARGLEVENLIDGAWSQYEEAIELDDSIDEAHEGLVRIHELAGRLNEAVDALERWASASSDPERKAIASYRAAEHALAFEETERAERALNRATEADPQLAPAWLLLCQLAGDRGETRETRRVCHDALDAIEPGSISAQISLRVARLAEVAGDNAEAIEHYGEAMRWDRRCTEASLCQSRLIRMSGDWVEADAVLSRFVDNHPDPESASLAQVHLERGRLLAGPLENVEAAIDAYRRSLSLQPNLRVATTALAGLLMHSKDRWRETLTLHREILDSSPTTAGSLRALAQIAKQRGQRETEEGALTVLGALGLATPEQASGTPDGLRVPIQPGPPMSDPESERLRRIAHQLREELGDMLADSGSLRRACDDASVSEAMQQIASIQDELSAPELARLDATDRKDLFTEIAALFLDPGGNGGSSRYRDDLDRSLGRWARRKVRRIVEETSLAEIEAMDHEAWGHDLLAIAAAQAIDRNGGDLATVLRALLVLEADEGTPCASEGSGIATRASASEPARRLLMRVTRMLCERLEHAG